MPPYNKGKLSKIEELKAKLFSRNFKTKIEHRDSFTHENAEVMDSWAAKDSMVNFTERFFMKTSFFKKFFIFSMGFFVTALLYGAYMFFAGGNVVSNDNIDITILGSSFTAGGEELPLQVGITNRNTLPLELVDLVVEYPKSSSGDLAGETERIRESLGTIPSGAVRNENVKIILYGGQGTVRPIRISLEYRVEGSNAIFVKEKLYEVNINSTPITISIDAPAETSPNQDIAIRIRSTLNSARPASQIMLKMDYPVGFQFVSSDPAPSLGTNVWYFGDLSPGAEREVSVVGRMIDVFDGEEKTFKAWTGTQSKRDKSLIDVVFNSAVHTLSVKRPFIQASFMIGGVKKKEYAIDSRTVVGGEVAWSTNLDTKINDLEIRAKVTGNSLNEKSIRPENGFYDSLSKTIIWNKSYLRELAEVNPGESGSVFFYFSPASTAGLANPSINVEVSISGKQEVSGFETNEIKNTDSAVIKIISDLGFAAKALHYTGPFTNTGPIPPKAEQDTTYTVVWSLSNSSNNISKAVIRAALPGWARFVGPISPASADLAYNSSSKEITWNAGNIPKGTGVTSPSKDVAFRISILPSLSQVGTAPTIINESVLTGHDDFANVDIRVSRPTLTTRITSEANFPPGGERVAE